ADEMIRDRPALESVSREQVVPPLAVAVILERLLHVEMIAPAREFDSIVTPLAGFLADHFQGQVGPLACEQGDGSSHGRAPESVWPADATGHLRSRSTGKRQP